MLELSQPQLLAPVAATGLIRESYLDSLLRGEAEPDTTTVDFLLNLDVIASTALRR